MAKIDIISQGELEQFPEGDPVPSVAPKEGYGNHSCQDCFLMQCPIMVAVSKPLGSLDVPNRCSFYWPPNVPEWRPLMGYYEELKMIANEIEDRRTG